MAGYRQTRINEEITHALSSAIRELKDPRIQNSVITVTDVECAKDLKNATVYFSFFSKKHTEKEIKAALKGAAGYLRTYLASKLNLRETPLLSFSYDNSIERGNRISELLREVTPTSAKTDKEENAEKTTSDKSEKPDDAESNASANGDK